MSNIPTQGINSTVIYSGSINTSNLAGNFTFYTNTDDHVFVIEGPGGDVVLSISHDLEYYFNDDYELDEIAAEFWSEVMRRAKGES